MNMRDLVQKHVPNASLAAPKRSKYGNRAKIVDGMRFASQSEAARWGELCLLQRGGQIHDLRRQVVYECRVNGELITKYIADFVYRRDGQVIVEDRKGGPETALFRIKRKLLHAIHGIDIEITRARR